MAKGQETYATKNIFTVNQSYWHFEDLETRIDTQQDFMAFDFAHGTQFLLKQAFYFKSFSFAISLQLINIPFD